MKKYPWWPVQLVPPEHADKIPKACKAPPSQPDCPAYQFFGTGRAGQILPATSSPRVMSYVL
jgi:hypothetical protein